MNRRDFLSGLGAASLAAGAAGMTAGAPPDRTYDVRRTDVRIPSWDGTELATTVFEPDQAGTYPVLLSTHGWGGSRDQQFGECEAFASRGYVAMAYDSRGFGASDGQVGVDGPKEVRDVSALVDWLEGRARVRPDPDVGMFGGSYAGGIQLNAAAHDDRIAAIVPEICWHDLNYALQPNGVVKIAWGAGLYAVGAAGSREHEFTSGDVAGLRTGMDTAVHRAFAEGVAANGYSEASETYFALRSPRYKLDAIDAPALLVQGWTDHLFVPNEAVRNFHGLRERGVEARLLFYNDGHQQIPVDSEYPQAVSVSDAARAAWLDAHLKRGRAAAEGRRRLGELLPGAVSFYDAQREAIRGVDDLPPADARQVTLRFGDAANATGDRTPLANAPGSNSYVVSTSTDPPGSSVDFDFPVGGALGGDVELLGVPRVDLRVRPLGRVAFLFVKPYHVSGGSATHVDDQVTPLRVTADTPGTVQDVSVELVGLQRHLAADDTLRLTVATADAGFNTARQSAGVVLNHDSTVRLPVR